MFEDRRTKKGFCIFPGYRYCGPGCSGPGFPINDVDAACKMHDECYEMYGPCLECDLEFMDRLREEMQYDTEEGRHARIMYRFMRVKTFFARY